jgi:DNA (cytosine-5)-methyltransferase 1
MKYLSVCSGIEAASVAWNPLGWQPIAFSEIEKFPSAVLQHHYPNIPNLGDMTKHEQWNTARPDILVGGTPCQSFSVAGLRKGLADARGNLTLTYLAIASQYRPQWICWENVPGVLSDKTNAFGNFLAGLSELGYGWAYRILDAQHFGVAQRRRRVFVVGCLGSWSGAAAVLFERESLQGNIAPRRKTRERPSAGPENVSGVSVQISDCQARLDSVAAPLQAGQGTDIRCQMQAVFDMRGNGDGQTSCALTDDHASRPTDYTPVVTQEVCGCLSDGAHMGGGLTAKTPTREELSRCYRMTAFGQYADDQTASALKQRDYKDATDLITEGGFFDEAKDVKQVQWASGGGKTENEPCQALRSGAEHNYQFARIGYQVRRLTPVECERLQGFPDNYTRIPWRGKPAEECPDGPRYKAIGNSMVVPCMRWIGRRIDLVSRLMATKRQT